MNNKSLITGAFIVASLLTSQAVSAATFVSTLYTNAVGDRLFFNVTYNELVPINSLADLSEWTVSGYTPGNTRLWTDVIVLGGVKDTTGANDFGITSANGFATASFSVANGWFTSFDTGGFPDFATYASASTLNASGAYQLGSGISLFTVTAIPEPTSNAALGLLALGLPYLIRRRRKARLAEA